MRRRRLVAAIALMLGAAACTVVDDTVVVEVGTLVPSLSDSDLAAQVVEVGLSPDGGTIQNIEWSLVTRLELDLDGHVEDLTFAEDCHYFDAAGSAPVRVGKCSTGMVIDGDGEPRAGTLVVEIPAGQPILVRRLRPLLLPVLGDYDGDGVPDGEDNCPLVDNPGQADTGAKGYGDACTLVDPFVGGSFKDSDADSVADLIDNCVYTPNPGQADSGTVFPPGASTRVRDGIGDACEAFQQVAEVVPDGPLSFGPIDMIQPFRRVSWLNLDFKSDQALSCDWAAGRCVLHVAMVVLCTDPNSSAGCS